MNKVARANCERGLSTVELTLALPLVIFAMLFLIGMGHALISKQHALVGGEFAAQYQRARESAPSAASAGKAVSAPAEAETFRLSGGGSDTLSYTANSTPQKGLIARLYRLKAAQAQYQTPNIINACVPHCKPFDSFGRLLSPETITGLLFSAISGNNSGNSGGFSGDDLLSAVAGKGKKPSRQKPPGATPISPLQASAAGIPGAAGLTPMEGPPAAGGGGGGQPPGRPPRRGAGTGGTDDNEPSGNGNKGGNNGSSALPPARRRPGEGINTGRRRIQWGNPNSVAAYGHSRSTHGAQRPPQQLKDRARSTGTPQGQFYDNNTIVEAEQRAPVEPGVYDVPMGRPIGRIYMPDGTVKEGATTVRVIRRPDGTIETSFPIG